MSIEASSYAREIEAYLCRKNDGHLIRVVGPSFELVSGWAARGVPLKVAYLGIDRCFDRYYRKGPRRRPVKVDFCEADVLDAFDEWKRAVLPGGHMPGLGEETTSRRRPSVSLPAHLERVLLQLTSARVRGVIGGGLDGLLDRVSRELDLAKAHEGGVRGDARHALIERLAALDRELVAEVAHALPAAEGEDIARGVDLELAPFRAGMTDHAFAQAREAAIEQRVRERFGLPLVRYKNGPA